MIGIRVKLSVKVSKVNDFLVSEEKSSPFLLKINVEILGSAPAFVLPIAQDRTKVISTISRKRSVNKRGFTREREGILTLILATSS